MARPGLKLASLYSYRPFTLGFCGPQESRLKNLITHYLLGEKVKEEEIQEILRCFVGAYPYYVLIAWKNKIKDPFDKKVVEAYWLGNQLLEKVTRKEIGIMILGAFAFPGWLDLGKARQIIKELPEGILPHHTFHILFMGSVTNTIEIKGKTIDLCRISWGEVKKVESDKLEIEYKPLVLKPKPKLGTKTKKIIAWEPHFVPNIKIGDIVSFHWDFVCDKLTKIQAKNLEKYTLHNLSLYAKKK